MSDQTDWQKSLIFQKKSPVKELKIALSQEVSLFK